MIDKYPMGESQPAQVDCRIQKCRYHQPGLCTNPAPAITLNPNGQFTCWSKEDRPRVCQVPHNIETSIRFRGASRGFVYIAKFKEGQYKIGSTLRNVKRRLESNPLLSLDGFTHAILTNYCRELELYLHKVYRDRAVEGLGSDEIFYLAQDDLEQIFSIETVNRQSVCHFKELSAALMHGPTIDFCMDAARG